MKKGYGHFILFSQQPRGCSRWRRQPGQPGILPSSGCIQSNLQSSCRWIPLRLTSRASILRVRSAISSESDETATFGMTQTFTAAGYNGQDYTITSSEAIGVTTTVDTITVSTPTNFLSTTTANGTKITQLQFDVGDANSGVTSGIADPLNYLTAVTGATSSRIYTLLDREHAVQSDFNSHANHQYLPFGCGGRQLWHHGHFEFGGPSIHFNHYLSDAGAGA